MVAIEKKIIKLSFDEKEPYGFASYQSSNPKTKNDLKAFIENKTTEFRSFNDMMGYFLNKIK